MARQAVISDVSFTGQISSLSGPKDNPTGFTLQLRNSRLLDFRVTPETTYKALSAEAEVEGLAANDYAIVTAHRVRRTWVASRISFDVRPIPPPARPVIAVVTGLVTSERADGSRFWMRLPSAELRTVMIPAKTTWRMDGVSVVGPLLLAKGNIVQVRMRRLVGSRVWFALDINLKSVAYLRV